MREHVLQRRQRVPVPAEAAFDFYADAVNLEPMTPPWLHFRLTTPGPIEMGVGTLLDYRLRLHGFPIRWRTRIETWEPPLLFSDTQVRGPYALWEHTHVFEPDGEHACTIHDRVRYAIWTIPSLTETLIYPRSDGVRFLGSFGPKEDSDATEVPCSPSPSGDRASSIRHQNRPARRDLRHERRHHLQLAEAGEDRSR